MLILYTGTTCPFCRRVEEFLNDKGIEFESRNVHENDEYLDELIEMGGKRQIPYLHDTETGTAMYESSDIIAYVEQTYGADPNDIVV